VKKLIQSLTELRARALEHADNNDNLMERVDPRRRPSARNLLCYLGIRHYDIRRLQLELQRLGLSSLGRLESCALYTLDTVIAALQRMNGDEPASVDDDVDAVRGPDLLEHHADELLGPVTGDRRVRIMVTMPSEAATNPQLVQDLLESGMTVMRINCAHDTPEAWSAMAENLHRARERTGLACRIYADLAGPKMRTGALREGPGVLKVQPQRDALGRVQVPGRVPLAGLSLPAGFATQVRTGDVLTCRDARGRKRRFTIEDAHAVTDRTAYLVRGTEMKLFRGREEIGTGLVGDVPRGSSFLTLRVGDTLILTRSQEPGHGTPPTIPCTLPEVFDCVKAGEQIWFDDGRLGGIVRQNTGSAMRVEITRGPVHGARLRAEKGINLPDTELEVPALTEKDLRDLDWIASHADLVGLSFVRHPDDVYRLDAELRARDARHLGVVLKIENRVAFERLRSLLLAGLSCPPLGVMVARGDLAVEVGFARLAEVQEEILWLCEAAHVPVIWATQVLENLAKKGTPSRAEVTDAAMSGRAECVMLNKGPYIVPATVFLSGVLERMESHQRKKTSMLRRLSVSRG
jgi:pyruvate kinase